MRSVWFRAAAMKLQPSCCRALMTFRALSGRAGEAFLKHEALELFAVL